MQIIFLPSTKSDVKWFYHYYKTVFPEGSTRAKKQFSSLRQALEVNPFLGHQSQDIDDARELHIARTPFTLVYRVTDTHIEVLRLWDTRQGG